MSQRRESNTRHPHMGLKGDSRDDSRKSGTNDGAATGRSGTDGPRWIASGEAVHCTQRLSGGIACLRLLTRFCRPRCRLPHEARPQFRAGLRVSDE